MTLVIDGLGGFRDYRSGHYSIRILVTRAVYDSGRLCSHCIWYGSWF